MGMVATVGLISFEPHRERLLGTHSAHHAQPLAPGQWPEPSPQLHVPGVVILRFSDRHCEPTVPLRICRQIVDELEQPSAAQRASSEAVTSIAASIAVS